MGYYELFYMAGLETIKGRICMGSARVAIDISSEAKNTPNHDNRATFARSVLLNPIAQAPTLTIAVLAANPAIAESDSTDQQIYDTLASIWDALAGGV